jgi:prevent-host-death family protein
MTIVMMKQVNVSEFKAVCLRLMEEVRQTGEPIEILKNGKPLVVVTPAPAADRRNSFGCMKHRLTGPVGDLLSPVVDESEWEVLR